MAVTDYYDRHGDELARRYDSRNPSEVHESWSGLLRERPPGLACDIGAGSGRDARWLANQGWEVVAVEPSSTMRRCARHSGTRRAVRWMDDTLPLLDRVRETGLSFDLILLSAVWQHVAPGDRDRAFSAVSGLLRPGGRMVITLRHGGDERENAERGFFAVAAEELEALAGQQALSSIHRGRKPDLQRRHVEWETLEFFAA
jgi:SAM-dependent methyltransferase